MKPLLEDIGTDMVPPGSMLAADANRPQLRSLRASSLANTKVLPRLFVLEDMIPDRTVSALTGDGGGGKSLLALHIAVCISCGLQWQDFKTLPGPAVCLSAEDELDEVHRRLALICKYERIDLAKLHDLHVIPLAGKDALLAVPDRERGTLRATPLFGRLEALVGSVKPRLVVIDTVADAFGGNENDRAHARSFIGLFRGIALDFDTAILLISHPSVHGLTTGSGTSGSTGWSNSVRSRLYLERPRAAKDEPPDEDARTLTIKKANYAAAGLSIELRYMDGVLVQDDAEFGSIKQAAQEARSSEADRLFLEILQLMHDQGRAVSATPSSNFAPAQFEKHPLANGFTRRAFAAAMERLLQAGAIHVEEFGPPSRRRQRLVV